MSQRQRELRPRGTPLGTSGKARKSKSNKGNPNYTKQTRVSKAKDEDEDIKQIAHDIEDSEYNGNITARRVKVIAKNVPPQHAAALLKRRSIPNKKIIPSLGDLQREFALLEKEQTALKQEEHIVYEELEQRMKENQMIERQMQKEERERLLMIAKLQTHIQEHRHPTIVSTTASVPSLPATPSINISRPNTSQSVPTLSINNMRSQPDYSSTTASGMAIH